MVIADASPLIGLAQIGHLGLLAKLFGSVTVTRTVADEVLKAGDFPDFAVLQAAFSESWLKTVDVATTDAEAWQKECRALLNLHQIDMGEASALVLARNLTAEGYAALLLIDDHRGRLAARHSQIDILGTAGMLVLAKQVGAIDSVRPLLLNLRHRGQFLSDRLIEATLAQVGE